MNKHPARSALGFCSLAALLALGACGSSAPVKGGHAGGGGTAGASGTASASGAGGTTSQAGASGGAGNQSTGAAGGQAIGTSGGTVSASDVVLTIPSGALPADTAITVATTTAPAGYTLASAVYQFGPDGTTFTKPVTISIPLPAPAPGAHLFWSNASGGFDDLGGAVTDTTLTGMVTHFSVGFAALPRTDGGAAEAPTTGSGGASGLDASSGQTDAAKDRLADVAADGGAAGATAADGGAAGAAGNDAGVASDADAGAGAGGTDAGAGVDAAALCAAFGLNAPVFQPVLVTDGGTAPAASTYAGGAIGSGQAYLTGVTHYGSQYGGPAQEVIIFDMTAKTMRIIDRVAAAQYIIGLDNVTNADAHTLVGDVVCSTYPQTLSAQMAWSYTLGTKLTMSPVGSSDVDVYSVALTP